MMADMNCYPDFITIDGAEGGTGAAPLVFTNYMGTPLVDALLRINNVLIKYSLRKDIIVIASGKVTNGFDIVKLIALGADGVNAARAFMMSLGCIQARECDKNTCPVGIATQDSALMSALKPEKRLRVFHFHKETIEEVCEIMGALEINNVNQLEPSMIDIRQNGVLQPYSEYLGKDMLTK